jgi:hypothetical protein
MDSPSFSNRQPPPTVVFIVVVVVGVFSLSYDITSSHITLVDSRVSGTHPATTCTCRILILFQKGKEADPCYYYQVFSV